MRNKEIKDVGGKLAVFSRFIKGICTDFSESYSSGMGILVWLVFMSYIGIAEGENAKFSNKN